MQLVLSSLCNYPRLMFVSYQLVFARPTSLTPAAHAGACHLKAVKKHRGVIASFAWLRSVGPQPHRGERRRATAGVGQLAAGFANLAGLISPLRQDEQVQQTQVAQVLQTVAEKRAGEGAHCGGADGHSHEGWCKPWLWRKIAQAHGVGVNILVNLLPNADKYTNEMGRSDEDPEGGCHR